MKTKNNKIQCPLCRRWVNKNGTAIMNHALNGRVTCKFAKKKGRQPKLDEDIAKIMIKGAKDGLSVKDIIFIAGISRETYNQWINNFTDFSDKMREARVERRRMALKSVKVGMITDWRAGAWELERRDKRYKNKQEVEVKGRPILIQDTVELDEYKKDKKTEDK